VASSTRARYRWISSSEPRHKSCFITVPPDRPKVHLSACRTAHDRVPTQINPHLETLLKVIRIPLALTLHGRPAFRRRVLSATFRTFPALPLVSDRMCVMNPSLGLGVKFRVHGIHLFSFLWKSLQILRVCIYTKLCLPTQVHGQDEPTSQLQGGAE